MKILYAFISLILLLSIAPQDQEGPAYGQNKQTTNDTSMTAQEWKRFRHFSTQLDSSLATQQNKETKLIAYTKDSLQILEVKLMAIKLLDERELLALDISENTAYYEALLLELQESAIAPMDYLFFERRMTAYVRKDFKRKTSQTTWIILGLVCISLFLGVLLFRKWKLQKTPVPELSKQENTVRNLMLAGKTNKEIANELFISLSTVKSHITNIYGKLQVSSRTELFQKGTGTST